MSFLRKILLVILLLGSTEFAVSQDFKTNILMPISVSYEHFLPDHRAIQAGLQFRPINLRNQSAEWFRTTAEYRIYKGRKIKFIDKRTHQQRGKYLAGYVRYSTCKNYSGIVEYTASKVTVGAMVGYKRYHFNKYTAEVFGGLGLAPWVKTSDVQFITKSDLRAELMLGISIGITNKERKKDGKLGV